MAGQPSDHPSRKLKALITGASRGIGYEIARHLQSVGVETVTPSREELDLLDPKSITDYLNSLTNSKINILINNAGINVIRSLEDLNDTDWAAMVQTNLTAPMRMIQGLSPQMKSEGWGRIVNISSVFSTVTKEKRAAYSATKSGLNGLTRTAAVELAPYGVLVNAVCPGYIDTALTHQNNSPADLAKIIGTIPLGRMAQSDEIAKFVGFLSSEDNTYITGQTLLIDGGFSCK
jgi:3-oxoacyl-[acyl-carrier protein] reductase